MPKSLVNITKDHPATVSVPITLKRSILIYANMRLPWDLGHPAHTPSHAFLQLSPPPSCWWGYVLVLLCTRGGGTGAPVPPWRGYWCFCAPQLLLLCSPLPTGQWLFSAGSTATLPTRTPNRMAAGLPAGHHSLAPAEQVSCWPLRV